MHCLRRASSSLLILVLLQLIAMVIMLAIYKHHPPEPISSSPPVPRKVHVLLLSSWRSGSSFLGQVFSQHPSVFYLMEPGWHVWTRLGMPGAWSLRMAVRDLLRQVMKCDFSVMESYMPPEPNVTQLFFWSHSRALCSPPVCPLTPRNTTSNQAQCLKQCKGGGLEIAEEACRNYTHVVLKEVRLFELESLYPLLHDPSLDLRIVHLVRDPRAVLRSRDNAYSSFIRDNALVLGQGTQGDGKGLEVQYRVMQEVCRSHMRIYNTAMLKPPHFLRDRYKVVRYEDLASDPLAHVEAIYRFTGLEMTPELQNWLHHITHGKGTEKAAFKITSRDAKGVSRAWRTSLSYPKVRLIQEVCKGAMSLLGYRPVDSEKEQKKMDLDVVLPLEPHKFSWFSSNSTKKSKP